MATFEKVLCYQFSGLMNAPWDLRQPGGAATVRLDRDFQQFFKTGHVQCLHWSSVPLLECGDLSPLSFFGVL